MLRRADSVPAPATAALPIIALAKFSIKDVIASGCTDYHPVQVDLPNLLSIIAQYKPKS